MTTLIPRSDVKTRMHVDTAILLAKIDPEMAEYYMYSVHIPVQVINRVLKELKEGVQ